MSSTLEDFLKATGLRTQVVEVAPGVTVKLRELTLKQRQEVGIAAKEGRANINNVMIQACAVEPQFPVGFDFENEVQPEVYAKLVQGCASVNGLGEDSGKD